MTGENRNQSGANVFTRVFVQKDDILNI